MPKLPKEVKRALKRARKLEKHHIPTDAEFEKENKKFDSLARKLLRLMKPVWFLGRKSKKK